MSKRKYNFNHITPQQLEAISKAYPNAARTIMKPNYRILSMLAECGAPMPEGIVLTEEKPAFLKEKKDA